MFENIFKYLRPEDYWLPILVVVMIVAAIVLLIVACVCNNKCKKIYATIYPEKVAPLIAKTRPDLQYFADSGITLGDFSALKYFYLNNYFVSNNSIVGKFSDGRQFNMCQIYTSEQNPQPKVGYAGVTTYNPSSNNFSMGGGFVVIPSPQGRCYYGTLFSFKHVFAEQDVDGIVIVSRNSAKACFENTGYYGSKPVVFKGAGDSDNTVQKFASEFEVYTEDERQAQQLLTPPFLKDVLGLSQKVGDIMIIIKGQQMHVLLVNNYLIPNPKIKSFARFNEAKYLEEIKNNLDIIDYVGAF